MWPSLCDATRAPFLSPLLPLADVSPGAARLPVSLTHEGTKGGGTWQKKGVGQASAAGKDGSACGELVMREGRAEAAVRRGRSSVIESDTQWDCRWAAWCCRRLPAECLGEMAVFGELVGRACAERKAINRKCSAQKVG